MPPSLRLRATTRKNGASRVLDDDAARSVDLECSATRIKVRRTQRRVVVARPEPEPRGRSLVLLDLEVGDTRPLDLKRPVIPRRRRGSDVEDEASRERPRALRASWASALAAKSSFGTTWCTGVNTNAVRLAKQPRPEVSVTFSRKRWKSGAHTLTRPRLERTFCK
jgi:hypothetical protein